MVTRVQGGVGESKVRRHISVQIVILIGCITLGTLSSPVSFGAVDVILNDLLKVAMSEDIWLNVGVRADRELGAF